MKIDVTEDGIIRLKDVFSGVMFETEEGEKLGVCMRDGGFEISVIPPGTPDDLAPDDLAPDVYAIRNGKVEHLGFNIANISLECNGEVGKCPE